MQLASRMHCVSPLGRNGGRGRVLRATFTNFKTFWTLARTLLVMNNIYRGISWLPRCAGKSAIPVGRPCRPPTMTTISCNHWQ